MSSRNVHLVGSFPFETAAETFELCGPKLAGLLRRIPDGEPGIRSQWINWQHTQVLPRTPQLEIGGQGQIPHLPPFPTYRIKPGLSAAEVRFPPLGYARAASESYRVFKDLQSRGRLDAALRFQVSLPTPFVVSFCYFTPESFAALWPVYEAALFAEMEEMARVIPPRELAIQWDIAAEVTVLETPAIRDAFPRQALIAGLVRAVDRVPAGSEVGLHLCYGDPGGKHVIEPKDLALLVELANAVSGAARHPIAWLHMPVPISRTDDEYFAALESLRVPGAELYLGLVHLADGLEGGRRRIAAAQRCIDRFGIATECGLGRRPRERIPEIVDLHAALARVL
jgi:hypothetical protein